MKEGLNTSFVISAAGLGVAVGALAPAIEVPFTLMFAVGLGMILGGVFRALAQIHRKIARPQSRSTGG